MNVHTMNLELNEILSMKDIKDKANAVKDGAKEATKKIVTTLKDELADNKKAFGIFKSKIKSKFGSGEAPSPEDFQKAINQMGDNARLVIIASIGATPGSALTLPLTMKIAKKMGIDLAPTKTF